MSLIDRVDGALGAGVEQLIRGWHHARLNRHGWRGAYEPSSNGIWCEGGPPPRDGCAVEVLIDGEEVLPAMADAIRSARSHVHLAGWHVTPDFDLTREGQGGAELKAVLADVASRIPVRVILWAGSPAPVFSPTRGRVRDVARRLTEGTAIHCELDSRERPMHCHHEKVVIIDGELAFVGGLDLTTLAGDRYDRRSHPLRDGVGWHDVAARVRGPVVADLGDHFRLRWQEVCGEELPADPVPEPAGSHRVQVVRTVPNGVYDALPRGDFRILEAYVRALRSARELVYVENQFLWSPEIASILEDKLRQPPSERFRVVAVLPAQANNGADVTRGQLARLVEADGDRGRLVACALYSREGARRRGVYVHAKVGIVDDGWLTLGSANLNEHSLFNDSEVNVTCDDPDLARSTRERLWAEHLECDVDEIAGRPAHEIVDELWLPTAEEQLHRLKREQPLTHRLVRLPGVSRRSRRLLGPLEQFAVDG